MTTPPPDLELEDPKEPETSKETAYGPPWLSEYLRIMTVIRRMDELIAADHIYP